MAPCAEAPHPVGYPVGGFYLSLASTFPAQFLPPTLLSVTFSFIARLNIKNLLNPKPVTARYISHGVKYESIVSEQYAKYMLSISKPVKVLKSGLVNNIN